MVCRASAAGIAAIPAGGKLSTKLAALGSKVASSLAATPRHRGTPERITALAAAMSELGYDATAVGDGLEIEAYNCVYHALAAANPDLCAFDLSLLAECSGAAVEHQACMVRGGTHCRFRFAPDQSAIAAPKPAA